MLNSKNLRSLTTNAIVFDSESRSKYTKQQLIDKINKEYDEFVSRKTKFDQVIFTVSTKQHIKFINRFLKTFTVLRN